MGGQRDLPISSSGILDTATCSALRADDVLQASGIAMALHTKPIETCRECGGDFAEDDMGECEDCGWPVCLDCLLECPGEACNERVCPSCNGEREVAD